MVRGALREDVQDQLGAIQHPPPQFLLEVALLAGRKHVVEDHGRRVHLVGGGANLLHLAAAGVEPGVGALAPAPHYAVAFRSGAFDEPRDLRDAIFVAVLAEVETHEHG